jgi:outer membrane protein OmpA-like peptidoglycan-associated protein
MNLVELLKDQVTGTIASQAASYLGAPEKSVTSALDGIFPALLSKTIVMAEGSEQGLNTVFDLAKNANTGILDNIGGLFGDASDVTDLMSGGSNILSSLLGNNLGSIIEMISKSSGLKSGVSSSLIKMAAPFLMSMVGKYIKEKALDATGLGKFLGSQKKNAFSNLPSGFGDLLGLGSMLSAVVGGGKDLVEGAANKVGGAADGAVNLANDAAKGAANLAGNAADVAGDVAEGAVKTGGSILKWLLPLLLLLAIASFFGIKTCTPIDNAVDATKDGVGVVAEGAADAVGTVADGAGAVASGAVDAVGAVADGVGAIFGRINEAGKEALDQITFTTGSIGDQMNRFIDGGFKGNPNFKFNNLTFETGSATITKESNVEVDNLAAIMKAYPALNVQLSGYTDNTGNAEKNVQLSQARANSVAARLIGNGVAAERITKKGYGSANPVASNDTPEGREQNRRIELTILK